MLGEPLPSVAPTPVADRDQNAARFRVPDGVEPVAAIAEYRVEIGPEDHDDVLAELAERGQADAEGPPDAPVRAVRADDETRLDPVVHPESAVEHGGVHAVAVCVQVDELDAEPRLAAERPEVVEQHRLDVVLRAAGRQRGLRARTARQ